MRKPNIEKRAQLVGEYVAPPVYASGLTRLVEYMLVDLNDLLEKEGRRFGIVLSYLDSIYQECQKMTLDNDDETSERIIYLFKPLILAEHKRLTKKHLSKADSVITLLRKLLEIIQSVTDFPYQKEIDSLKKIVDKLWDNIRNKSKLTSLENFEKTITDFMEEGVIGKYGAEKFSILEEEEKRCRKPLEGNGVMVEMEQGKVLEVTWGEGLNEKKSDEHTDS
jgi:hypothetical protein